MQQEDDLRGLAKIMEFMRAISILFVVIHVYWFCYSAMRDMGVHIETVDRILQNFQRTAGLFGSLLTTKVFAVVFLALSCLGTQGVKNETITWEKIYAALLAGVVLFFMNWWLLALPLSAVANMAFYTLTLTPEYLLGGTGTLQQPHRQTHQQEGATQIVGNHRRVADDLLSRIGQPHRHGTIE